MSLTHERIYVLFYKPRGILCSFTDSSNRPTLKQYINIPDIYSAGRLDMDSEGLILLSNDGNFIHRITNPEFHIEKTYLVEVEGQITSSAISKLERGVTYQRVKTKKCHVLQIPRPEIVDTLEAKSNKMTQWLRIVLREGKKHQIRHMTASVGLPTIRLIRIAIGKIGVGNLHPGEWRYLSPEEVSWLMEMP